MKTNMPMKMEQSSKMSAHKIQTLGNYPEEAYNTYSIVLHSFHCC